MGSSYKTETEVRTKDDKVIASGSTLWHEPAPADAEGFTTVQLYPNGEAFMIQESDLAQMTPGPYDGPPEKEPAIHTGPDA